MARMAKVLIMALVFQMVMAVNVCYAVSCNPNNVVINKETTAPVLNTTEAPDFGLLVAQCSAVKELSYDLLIKNEGRPGYQIKWTVKDFRCKAEYKLANGLPVVEIIDTGNKTGCVYCITTGQIHDLTLAEIESLTIPNPENLMRGAEISSAEYVGESSFDGHQTCTFLYHDRLNGDIRIWMRADNGIPLKLSWEVDGMDVSYEFYNLMVGGIDDSIFYDLPENLTFVP